MFEPFSPHLGIWSASQDKLFQFKKKIKNVVAIFHVSKVFPKCFKMSKCKVSKQFRRVAVSDQGMLEAASKALSPSLSSCCLI